MTRGFEPNFFDPASHPDGTTTGERVSVQPEGGRAYLYDDTIILAVNVALATHRPLLIAGEPGTGKTTLATNVAHVIGWRFDQQVVTSRTRARDLLWTVDSIRRLADAQLGAKELRPRAEYVEPRSLWWAFDPVSAARRGPKENLADGVRPAVDRGRQPAKAAKQPGSVVLIDEIDKAEPDVPNDLLEPLDTGKFRVEDLDEPYEVVGRPERVLLCLTTNQERELPAAFLRRCVVLSLPKPTAEWFVTIADVRFGKAHHALHTDVATRVMELRAAAERSKLRPPSTAEYLDAVEACRQIGKRKMPAAWKLIEQSLLWKRDDPAAPEPAPRVEKRVAR